MSARRFGQIPLNLWRNPHFKKLSMAGKVAALFYWCGPHSTSAGVGLVPDAYATADLGLLPNEWLAAREEVEASGLVERDGETETVLVLGFFEANRPVNARHRAAILNQISTISSVALREKAEAAFSLVDTNKPSQEAGGQNVTDLSPQMRRLQDKQNLRGVA